MNVLGCMHIKIGVFFDKTTDEIMWFLGKRGSQQYSQETMFGQTEIIVLQRTSRTEFRPLCSIIMGIICKTYSPGKLLLMSHW